MADASADVAGYAMPIGTAIDAGDGRVLILTLDRPAQRNAMSQALVDAMQALLDDAAQLADVRAIVVTGAGRGFCAGSDLAELAGMTPAARGTFEAASGRLARTITRHPLPIVAAVAGFAIGGGLTLAAACDHVVTAPAAIWSLPEVPIGLFPAWGLEAVVQRTGRSRARRLSWGIAQLDGTGAVTSGLADEVADDPLTAALAIARRLADLPAEQAAAVKRYFAEQHEDEAGDALANELFLSACDTTQAAASFIRYGTRR